MRHLVVTNPFGGRARGDHITDPGEIAAVLASENSGHVRAIEGDEPLEPNVKVGELIADGETHETVIEGEHPAAPAEHEGA